MLDVSLENSGDVAFLKLRGEMTVQSTAELKACIIQAFGNVENIFLDMAEVSDVDVSSFQFLCAAYRTATLLGKNLKLTGNVPLHFRMKSSSAGFDMLAGSDCHICKTCIWRNIYNSKLPEPS